MQSHVQRGSCVSEISGMRRSGETSLLHQGKPALKAFDVPFLFSHVRRPSVRPSMPRLPFKGKPRSRAMPSHTIKGSSVRYAVFGKPVLALFATAC